MMKTDRTTWFAILFLAGVLLSIIDRVYYTMFFLPDYHGSYVESVKHIVDVDGFVAFIKTAPGAILTGVTLCCYLGAAVLVSASINGGKAKH